MALREPFPGFPPPLTTRPEGLLSMLGLQTNGSYPQHLAYDQLQPTLDLLNWYLESRAEVNTQEAIGVNVAPGAFRVFWQVPPQEVWVLLALTLRPVALANTCSLQLVRTRSNDDGSRIALSDPVAFAAASFPLIRSSESVRHIVFRPSVQIGVQFVSGVGVGNTFDGCLRFVRCQI